MMKNSNPNKCLKKDYIDPFDWVTSHTLNYHNPINSIAPRPSRDFLLLHNINNSKGSDENILDTPEKNNESFYSQSDNDNEKLSLESKNWNSEETLDYAPIPKWKAGRPDQILEETMNIKSDPTITSSKKKNKFETFISKLMKAAFLMTLAILFKDSVLWINFIVPIAIIFALYRDVFS